MDGNVRRVLSRLFAVPGRTGERAFENELWRLATLHTPVERVAQYTQAIMDLGATLCTRRQPRCAECPFIARCMAHAADAVHDFPAPKKPLQRRAREVWMLLARRADGSVRLVQRPPQGVWGGLWSPPEYATRADAATALMLSTGATQTIEVRDAEPLQHAFTHFDLIVTPLLTRCEGPMGVMEAPQSLWYNPRQPARIGLPAPIKALLTGLTDPIMTDERAAR